MALTIQSPDEHIRDIGDIINIQIANGSFQERQVAFSLPTAAAAAGADTQGTCALARSLESALAPAAAAPRKKRRARRRKSPLADAVSWPSDSDITVLRMKGCAREARAARGREGAAVAGDGLHGRPDGSSMVNLATLVQPAAAACKQELLLPLSSWERAPPPPDERAGTRARLARFLRLYFCPCCTCLYEMEKSTRDSRDVPSVYLTAAAPRDSP